MRHKLKASLLMLVLFIWGCGDSNNSFVFTGPNNTPSTPAGLTLRVSADPAALGRGVLAQFTAQVVELQVTLYDEELNELEQQSIPTDGTAVFENLAEGNYLVRMIGLGAGGEILGYFDRVVALDSDQTEITIPTLLATANPPEPVFPTGGGSAAFLAFVEFPDTVDASTPFSVSVQAFDSQGNPFSGVVGDVTLISNAIAFEVNPAAQSTDPDGSLTIDNLSYGPLASGQTSLTVSSPGLLSVNSLSLTVGTPPPVQQTNALISAGISGNEATGQSRRAVASADGRFVAFDSAAADLVSGDDEGNNDVFVRDRQTGVIERISVTPGGEGGNGGSSAPSISADGRFVAFSSDADDLVAGDGNSREDVFVFDRQSGTMELVSVAGDGTQGLLDSSSAGISGDGQRVVFLTRSDFAGGTSANEQVYLRDRGADTTTLVSKSPLDAEGSMSSSDLPRISSDGSAVVYRSDATNLVTGDGNTRSDIFLYDVATDTNTLVSTNSTGTQGNFNSTQPSVSSDGRFITFTSSSTNLVTGGVNQANIYHKDLSTGAVIWVSQAQGGGMADGESFNSVVSGDGRFVVYASSASDLVSGDGNANDDIFVYDTLTGTNTRVSLSATGGDTNGFQFEPQMSQSGNLIVFTSDATNIVGGGQTTLVQNNVFSVANPFRR